MTGELGAGIRDSVEPRSAVNPADTISPDVGALIPCWPGGCADVAAASPTAIRMVIAGTTLAYLGCLFLPASLHQFGKVYVAIALVAIIPLHAIRTLQINSASWLSRLDRISLLYKLEMVAGLTALAADEVVRTLLR